VGKEDDEGTRHGGLWGREGEGEGEGCEFECKGREGNLCGCAGVTRGGTSCRDYQKKTQSSVTKCTKEDDKCHVCVLRAEGREVEYRWVYRGKNAAGNHKTTRCAHHYSQPQADKGVCAGVIPCLCHRRQGHTQQNSRRPFPQATWSAAPLPPRFAPAHHHARQGTRVCSACAGAGCAV